MQVLRICENMRTTEIINPRKNIALKASAGSGKTFALSLRVVNLLLNGVRPDRILCITFTNKATNEMYQRIIALIRYLAFELSPSNINDEARYLLLAQRSDAVFDGINGRMFSEHEVNDLRSTAFEIWQEVVRSISRLRITTIDSFFNTILRLFPFEAGVMPDFRVLSDIVHQRLSMDAFEVFVEDLEHIASLKDLVGELIKKSGKAVNSPATFLYPYFERLLDMRIGVERLVETMLTCFKEGEGNACFHDISTRLKHAGEMDIAIRVEARAFANRLREVCQGISQFGLNEIEKYSSLDAASLTGLTSISKDSYSEYRYFGRCGKDKKAQALFKKIKRELPLFIQQKNSVYRDAIIYLFSLFIVRLDRIKRREKGMTFSDVTNTCYNLLVDSGLVEKDREYFYFRLDSRIDHLLIDEFQDTNVIQWLILKPFVDELTAGLGQREEQGSFFYVGDPKQSIYRFRGGESRLFETVLEKYEGRIDLRSLDTNFRSAEAIVEFVNTVFTNLKDNFNFDYEIQSARRGERGYVEAAFLSKQEARENPGIKEGKVIAWVKRLLGNGYHAEDIAVLCGTNKDCEEYAEVLAMHGIPAVTEGSMTILHSAGVDAILEFLRYLNDPGQYIYLLSFLFSVPGLLTQKAFEALLRTETERAVPVDIREKMLKILSRVGLLPVVNVIRMIIDEFDLYNRFDRDPNIGLLLDMASRRELDDTVALSVFLGFVDDELSDISASRTESVYAVKVLTVHKAKGLEFPCVIVPEVEIGMSVSARDTQLICEYSEDLFIKNIYLNENKYVLPFYSGLKQAVEEERKLTIRDRLNQLYVALTRAEDALFIIAVVSDTEGTGRNVSTMKLSDVLHDALGRKGYTQGILPSRPSVARDKYGKSGSVQRLHEVLNSITAHRQEIVSVVDEGKERETTTFDNFRARRFGIAFHYAIEVLRDFREDTVDESLDRVRAAYGSELSDDDIALLKRRMELLLGDEIFLDLISGKRIEKEITFVCDGNASVVDLIAVGDEVVNVIDFKTTYEESLIDRYQTQIWRYCSMVSDVFGLPSRGILCFVLEDAIQYKEI